MKMKRIVSLKKTTLDAIRDSEYIGNARIVNKLPKVGDKDKNKATPCSVVNVKKIKTEKGYSIYKVTYQYDDTIELGKKGEDVEGVDTYSFTYAVKDGVKDSISGETWIDTPELLEEDDFQDPYYRKGWVRDLKDIGEEKLSLKTRIDIAEMLLGTLSDIDNRYVREEVEGDLRDFLKKNKPHKFYPKPITPEVEAKLRNMNKEPFTDSNGGIEDLFKKAIVKKGNWYEFDEKALPKYQPRKFEWMAKSDNSCIVKYNGTEYYIYLNPTTGKLEVELN